MQQTGYDPAKPPPPAPTATPPTTATGTTPGAGARGAARGAVVGEIVGGDASTGAAVGAAAARGQSRRQNAATAQQGQQQQQAATQQQQAELGEGARGLPGRARLHGQVSARRAAGAALLAIVAVAPLQGCLLDRVLATKAQLCDQVPPGVVLTRTPGSSLRVVFAQPTLTEQDVVWIIGFEPSSVGASAQRREMAYEVRPLARPLHASAGFVARLAFDRVGGESRLAEVEIPPQLDAVLSQPLLDAAVKVACKAKIGVAPPRTTFDLRDVDRATLPDREALARLLGLPPAVGPPDAEMDLAYCLVPCDES